MKTCPFCAEEIQDAAIKCKHCGEMLGAAAERTPAPVAPPVLAQAKPVIANPELIMVRRQNPLYSTPSDATSHLVTIGLVVFGSVGAALSYIVAAPMFKNFKRGTPKLLVKGRSTYKAECPHCSRPLINNITIEDGAEAIKPWICIYCNNWIAVSDDHKRIEKSAVGVGVVAVK